MKYLSAAAMREADRRCIQELGIPGAVLMHNAGNAIFGEVHEGPVGVVCGKGNNGGDGYVVAYLALLAGYQTRVVVLAEADDIKGDAAIYLNVYRNLGGAVVFAPQPDEARKAVVALVDCSVLVDAMLGTGAKGAIREPFASVIAAWPKRHTIAVDIPSGLDADTGEAGDVCIAADVTVTIQYAKQGFQAPSAQRYLGRVVVADIGIPAICADDDAWERR